MQITQTPYKASALARPERILVATDLTDLEFLLPHAMAQARESGARVTLVHAVPASYVVPIDPAAIPYVDCQQILAESEALIGGTAKHLEGQGITCNVMCKPGSPLEVMQQELRESGATTVIMGTQGRGKLGQLALGSVAHDLVSKLDVPILVVGPQAHHQAHGAPRRILHPVSMIGDYRESVALAVEFAIAWKAELTLLYVFSDDVPHQEGPDRRVEWARTALTELVPDEMYLAGPVHTTVAFGKVPEQILKTAAEIKADWIVMGVNAHAQFWSFREDAAYRVIAGAACPVLTLRHPAQALSGVTAPVQAAGDRAGQLLANAGIF